MAEEWLARFAVTPLLPGMDLSPAAFQAVEIGLRQINRLTNERDSTPPVA